MPITPAELENLARKCDAAIVVLQMLAAEFLAAMPEGRRATVMSGMQRLSELFQQAQAGPSGLEQEMSAEHSVTAIRNVLTLMTEPPFLSGLAAGGGGVEFGSGPFQSDIQSPTE